MKMGGEYTASPFDEFKPAHMLLGLNEKESYKSICNGILNPQHTFYANLPTFYICEIWYYQTRCTR
jgi:hypothetical protein